LDLDEVEMILTTPVNEAHILRLLATHHIFQELSPDVFALNRISSMIDSGKAVEQLAEYRSVGR
jgi:hypothetical protein